MLWIKWIIFLTRTSARGLWRSPSRTVFSLGSVSAATAAILVFQSFVISVSAATRENVIRAHYGHFEITQNGFQDGKSDNPFGYQITDAEPLRQAIERKVGPLSFLSRRLEFYGLLNWQDRSIGAIGLGIDAKEERKFLTLAQAVSGQHLADGPDDGIFVGEGLAKAVSLKVGDVVSVLVTTSTGSINASDLTVVGIFRTGVPDLDERTFYLNLSIAETLLRVKGAPRVLLAFAANDELPFQGPLNQLLQEEFPNLRASHWRERAVFYENLLGWLNKQVFVFYAIVLLIASISIANVFTMSLLERTGEFGTLRAIGTSRPEVAGMIFAESMIQAFVGAGIGCVIAILVIVFPLAKGITMPPPPMMSVPFQVYFGIPWSKMGSTIALCTAVAGLSGLLPAIHVARMNIVKALGRNV